MVSIEQVDERVHDVPYMQLEQAKILQELWETCPEGDILELGFAHGKGSAFLGALASARGGQATCVDNPTARHRDPSAPDVVKAAGVDDAVDLVFAEDGYLWWMKQQLEAGNAQRFSLIYLDGAHDWFIDGFAVLMLSYFLKPGGILVLDDLDWSFSISRAPDIVERVTSMSPDVATQHHIRKVWELLIQPDPSWGELREISNWAIARRLSSIEDRGAIERIVIRPSPREFLRGAASLVRRKT
ncbi:MAG: class I SAM-dependent methyltransferase [Actinomycetes bacterium]